MKMKSVFRVLQLSVVVLLALFLAGIAAPSFLRSGLANHDVLASGSLHAFTIARITFTYTFWNLASAVLGALFGAVTVLAASAPFRLGPTARIGRRALGQLRWKWRLFRKNGRSSYIGSHYLA